jgi:hypothetical protein
VSDAPKAGAKLKDEASGVEAIVVKPSPEPGLEIGPSEGEPVTLGKRYTCEACGAEALIIKGGQGQLSCHGVAMVVAQPKILPSSD